MPRHEKIFLSAEWRDLLMLNYEVDPAHLQKYVPAGTELDSFAGKTYVSLVGFRFCHTKLLGKIPIPFHTEFEEINLRLYVKRREGNEIRRGVVFIAEIVPKPAIALTARWFYGENYVRRPMEHQLDCQGAEKFVEYRWRGTNGWCRLNARFLGQPRTPDEGSLQQFIAEHYWGYSAQKNRTSFEYRVEHVPWKVWRCSAAEFGGDPTDLYGTELSGLLKNSPDSAFVAEGSLITVYDGQMLA